MEGMSGEGHEGAEAHPVHRGVGPDADQTPFVAPTPPALAPALAWGGVVSVWVLAVVCGVVIAVVGTASRDSDALGVALGSCVVATLGIQVSLQRKEGILSRMSWSMGGAAIVLVVVAGLLVVVR